MGLQAGKTRPVAADAYRVGGNMVIWLSQKTKPHETNKMKPKQRRRFCRICNTPIYSGTFCPSCKAFIEHKKREEQRDGKHEGKHDERRGKNDH